jgi:hypothetical protein
MTEEAYNVVPRPRTELCWVNAQVNTIRDVFKDISEAVGGLEDGCKREIRRRVDLRCVWKTQSMPSGVTEVAGAWIGS